MTPSEILYAAASGIPTWKPTAVVALFGLAAVGFLLWWDLMFGGPDE